MKCEKCRDAIETGEERARHGRILCEDCYMDALSPACTCDPWAVNSAKSFVNKDGKGPEVKPIQARIPDILSETGGVEPRVLVERLDLKPSDLEREIAALRHMEKVRGQLRQGKRIIRLW